MSSNSKSKRDFKERTSLKCESCGYKEYPQILTMHHLYAKRNGAQPSLPRRMRYLVVCPNCHVLIERGIFNDKAIHQKVLKEWENEK